MSGGKNSISVSFTHISEDVIMPSDQMKYKNGLKFSCIFTYGFLGIIWLLILFAAGFRNSDTWVAFVVLFGIATISELFSRWKLYHWIEIDRNDGTIKSWSNNKKKNRPVCIKRENVKAFYAKVKMGGRYSASTYTIYLADNTAHKNTKALTLFILHDKTEEPQARTLTVSVEKFLKDYLNGKEIRPCNQEYRFDLPRY
jgi:hypothetical protein